MKLFPLSLAVFEEYMLMEDRPAYPMFILFAFRFRGRLDRTLMELALQDALKKHPLLNAVVREDDRGRREWVAAAEGHQWILWSEGDTAPTPRKHFDIRSEPGLCLSVTQSATEARLLFQFHHSSCDGRGALVFVGDLLQAYAVRQGSHAIEAALPEPGRWSVERDGFYFKWRDGWRLFCGQLTGLVKTLQMLTRPAMPLLPHQPPPAQEAAPAEFPAWRTHWCEAAETARLRAAARQRGVTTHEVLTRDLYLAIDDWQRRHATDQERGWLRLIVPIDLRQAGDDSQVIGNMTSLLFLDQHATELEDPDQLLSAIHDEMDQIKRWRLGLAFIGAVKCVRRLRGLFARLIARPRCWGTCLMTNVGRVFHHLKLPRHQERIMLGDAVLESMEFVAPLRSQTCAAFCLFEYGRQLGITLHYDPRFLTESQAEDLLATYVGFLKKSPPP